jgi:hypothetical protein
MIRRATQVALYFFDHLLLSKQNLLEFVEANDILLFACVFIVENKVTNNKLPRLW